MSEVASYIDQIETGGGGGNEVDLTQFNLYYSIVLIFTDIPEGSVNSVKVNNEEHLAANWYNEFKINGEKIIVAVFLNPQKYSEPVSITVEFRYEGEYTNSIAENIDLNSPKLICVTSR